MFNFFRRPTVRDLAPAEVARAVTEGRAVIVDVREPNETAIERIPGSVLLPLSRFDPREISDLKGKMVVFSCRSGVRSVRACELARAAGLACDAHLAGGLIAWKAAGLPTES